jgi:hypothetical protein
MFMFLFFFLIYFLKIKLCAQRDIEVNTQYYKIEYFYSYPVSISIKCIIFFRDTLILFDLIDSGEFLSIFSLFVVAAVLISFEL